VVKGGSGRVMERCTLCNHRKEDMDTLAVVKDVDALAEERVGDRLNLYVAEIKRTLTQNHVKK
jgi:hypothetical protein